MLKISKLTDYAIMVCTHIANQNARAHQDPIPSSRTCCGIQEGISAKTISEQTQLGLATIKKVLRMLMQGNILNSEKGYALSRQASEITLTQIIEAMEGNLAITECSANNNTCEIQGNCGITKHWQHINRIITAALSNITLADLAMPYQEWEPVMFEQLNKHIAQAKKPSCHRGKHA